MRDEQETLPHHRSLIAHHAVDLSLLRASMREKRRTVTPEARRIAAIAIANRAVRMRLLRKRSRIAVYNAIDGEIDLAPLVRRAQRRECALYAPRIIDMRAREMEFLPIASFLGTVAKATRTPIDPRTLDVVFVPLVAFDRFGWRLGFGAGFYDRKFAFMHRGRRQPLLIGVGYDFQLVDRQLSRPWDVPLHAVLTERRIYRCGLL